MTSQEQMAEDELDKIFFRFHRDADNAWRKKNYQRGLEIAQREAKAAINAYTTNKIIEELGYLVNNQNNWRGGHGYRAITLEVLKERIDDLKALNHRKDD